MEKRPSAANLNPSSSQIALSQSVLDNHANIQDQHQSQVAALQNLQQESRAVEIREAKEAEKLEQLYHKANVRRSVTRKEKDEKDTRIEKLKSVNQKLRQRLKELNAQLEKTIEKANSRKVQKSLVQMHQQQRQGIEGIFSSGQEAVVEHQVRIKEKELKNAQTQVELYKKELQQLQSRVDDLSGVDRLMQLENRLKEGIAEKAELEKKVKELERQHKDQGKALEKMANEEEFQAKMKCLVDELRIWKEKVKKLELQQEKEEQTRKVQVEKIQQVQEENKKYQSVIDQLKAKKGILDAEKQQLEESQMAAAQKQENLEKLEQEKKNLEQQIADEEKKHRAEMRKWEKKIKASEERLEQLQKELREKEAENRISKLKIKEMRRLIKHNQLKPLPQQPLLAVAGDYESNDQPIIAEKIGGPQDNVFLTDSALDTHPHATDYEEHQNPSQSHEVKHQEHNFHPLHKDATHSSVVESHILPSASTEGVIKAQEDDYAQDDFVQENQP